VKKISGTAEVNKEGNIIKHFVTMEVCGKDKDGIDHILVFDMVLSLSDINSTVIKKPDLTGKKVQKEDLDAKQGKEEK
jgi:hypothetical protein